jgi:hypothetical protein
MLSYESRELGGLVRLSACAEDLSVRVVGGLWMASLISGYGKPLLSEMRAGEMLSQIAGSKDYTVVVGGEQGLTVGRWFGGNGSHAAR